MLDATINILIDPTYTPPKEKKSVIRDYAAPHYVTEIQPDIIANLSDKIKNRYNHIDVKKQIREIFDALINNLKQVSSNIESAIVKFVSYVEILDIPQSKLVKQENSNEYHYGIGGNKYRAILVDIINSCDDLNDETTLLLARLTDIYFLRRFLDKDYITNAIVFTGALHSQHYIEILVGYFNFKITHTAYSLIDDMDKLTIETKKRVNNNEVFMELFYPPELYQCSDITHFPKNFE